MKLGARIFKTGLAIALAIFLSELLQLSSTAFAGISAIFALQPTVYRSFKTLRNQFQANILGAMLAIVFTMVFGTNPIVVAFTAILMLSIALKLKMQDYVSIALVTIVAIMEYAGSDFLHFAMLRFTATFLGLISASLVNLLFFPPSHGSKLHEEIERQTKDMSSWIRISLHQAADYMALKEEIDKHREEMMKLRYYYLLYKEEYQSRFKKDSYSKARRLVLFRKMVAATDETFEILQLIHKFEPELMHLPEKLQDTLKENLDNLITFHEQALLKFTEKVKVDASYHLSEELQEKYEELVEQFTMFLKDEDTTDFLHLVQLFASMTVYKEKLESLDELLHSYHKFHKVEDSH